MLKLKKILSKAILFFLLCSYAHAEGKLAYLDIDYILSNINIGKSLFIELKNDEDKILNQLKTQEKKLKEEEKKILAKKNIISKDQLNLDINKLKNKAKLYNETKSKEIEKLKKIRNDKVVKLLQSINPLIEQYMTENSISVLIDKKNIYIANKNYDITDILIDLINNNFKNN